ncbi:MAG TPA: UvrD-helicase domain-containing protein [Pseudolysinimonas sp.]|nr:UvrD-helicase domain-containing protein [Pseudolysinimonas sp.]
MAADVAAHEAARQRALADELARRAGLATTIARAFEQAPRVRTRLAQTLLELESLGYALLTDRQWPGSRDATIDLVLVGPGGVIIVEASSWRAAPTPKTETPETETTEAAEATDPRDAIARLADLVYSTQRLLAEIGLAAGEVRAIAAFASPFVPRTTLFGVQILSEAAAVTEIARLGQRLTPLQVATVRNALAEYFPPAESTPFEVDAATRPPIAAWEKETTGIPTPGAPQTERLTAEQVRMALSEGLQRAPVDEWMTFLTPEQAQLVRTSFAGPSRISGGAGTGKSVVALHRAAYLARSTGGRVLVTSYVRTLPKRLRALMERLAPDVANQIDFRGVHEFARDVLTERHGPLDIDATTADRIFKDLWNRDGKDGELGRLDATPGYWHDEIRHVLKGRGLTDFGAYAELPRLGRRRQLTTPQRAELWNLYHRYEAALHEREIFDWEDVILEAESSLASEPLTSYAAVIVDEAQDMSCSMIRMLHSLVGDRPDGLTLITDGQQTIYPGGYTLAEAGVDIQGRSVVLGSNQRTTKEIAQFAAGLLAGDLTPDIETVVTQVTPPTVEREGNPPIYTVFPARAAHDRALVEHIRRLVAESGTSLGDIGVLALYSWHAAEVAETLAEAGIASILLKDYDGYPVEAVKVGTIKRAKGLEFAQTLVARTPPHLVTAGVVDPDETAAERRVLQRRELYVGMMRARDGLWVGVA